jgi:hypothetical protein
MVRLRSNQPGVPSVSITRRISKVPSGRPSIPVRGNHRAVTFAVNPAAVCTSRGQRARIDPVQPIPTGTTRDTP